jgi:hypothetical protein
LNIHFQTMKLATSGVITGRKMASLNRVRPRLRAGCASRSAKPKAIATFRTTDTTVKRSVRQSDA